MTASLRARLRSTGLDRLVLALIGLGFVLLFIGGLLDGLGPVGFIAMFLSPILNPTSSPVPVDLLFVCALLLAGWSALRRTNRSWRTPVIEAGGSVPLSPGWRERAARAVALLGERRGVPNEAASDVATPPESLPAQLMTGDLPKAEDPSGEDPS